jgi:hypothetical protein
MRSDCEMENALYCIKNIHYPYSFLDIDTILYILTVDLRDVCKFKDTERRQPPISGDA